MSVTFSLLTKIFLLVLYNFFALVSEEIEEEASGRIYSNTLAVSGNENSKLENTCQVIKQIQPYMLWLLRQFSS